MTLYQAKPSFETRLTTGYGTDRTNGNTRAHAYTVQRKLLQYLDATQREPTTRASMRGERKLESERLGQPSNSVNPTPEQKRRRLQRRAAGGAVVAIQNIALLLLLLLRVNERE